MLLFLLWLRVSKPVLLIFLRLRVSMSMSVLGLLFFLWLRIPMAMSVAMGLHFERRLLCMPMTATVAVRFLWSLGSNGVEISIVVIVIALIR